MAALPVVISAATIAYSMFFPDGNPGSSSDSSRAVVPTTTGNGMGPFFYGMVVGMGLSSWVTYEFRRKRVWEHVRLAFFSWLYDSEEEEVKLADKFRKPVKVEDLEGEPMQDAETDSCGVRRELLSPDWALTSNLNVTVLALPSGTELVAKKAEGVEFYYVIKGEGDYFSGEDTNKITSGTGFVVDPGCERGFTARGRGDLVLLRATDTPLGGGHEVTRLQASSFSSTMAVVSAGLNKMEKIILSYSKKQEHESS